MLASHPHHVRVIDLPNSASELDETYWWLKWVKAPATLPQVHLGGIQPIGKREERDVFDQPPPPKRRRLQLIRGPQESKEGEELPSKLRFAILQEAETWEQKAVLA